jgi:hypothetical protein
MLYFGTRCAPCLKHRKNLARRTPATKALAVPIAPLSLLAKPSGPLARGSLKVQQYDTAATELIG